MDGLDDPERLKICHGLKATASVTSFTSSLALDDATQEYTIRISEDDSEMLICVFSHFSAGLMRLAQHAQ